MRKVKTLLLMTLVVFMAGCFGINADVYDGSPTTLSVTVQSKVDQTVRTMSEQEGETVLVRVWRTNEEGVVIYSEHKNVGLDTSGKGELSAVVPAGEGYSVMAIQQEESAFNFGETETNVPANKVTNISLFLENVSALIDVPEKAYSGGDYRQFRLKPHDSQGNILFTCHLATWPWLENGEVTGSWNAPEGTILWSGSTSSTGGVNMPYFPTVDKPTKIYYQYGFLYIAPGLTTMPHAVFPDLEKGEELPYIWLYPSPDWEPVVE